MPTLIHVERRWPLHFDARAAHNFIYKAASRPDTNTLYFREDYGGRHFTVVTDDTHFNPFLWRGEARDIQMREYHPAFYSGQVCEFRVRLDRARRHGGRSAGLDPYSAPEDIDRLIERQLYYAGAAALEYDVTFDVSGHMGDGRPCLPSVTVTGQLEIIHPHLYHQATRTGLGRAKRFGCGLLLSHPVTPPRW